MYEQGRQEQTQNARGTERGASRSRQERDGSNPENAGARGGSRSGGRDRFQAAGDHSMRIAELAIRGTATLLDIQFGALRSAWQMQARAAALFGMPDSSDLLRITDDSFQRVWTSGTEQLLASTRQANEALGEMQRQFGQILEEGTCQLSEQLRSGMEDLGERTQSNLHELQQVARQGAAEGRRMLREGGQFAGAGQERSGIPSDAQHAPAQASRQDRSGSASSQEEGEAERPFLTARERREETATAGREAQGSRQAAERNGSRGGKRH